MKNNILKSIFVTILLLLGVSQTTWGTDYYYRGNQNSWGTTLMEQSSDGYYAYYKAKSFANNGNQNNMFKIALTTSSFDYGGSYLKAGFNSTDITNMGGNWDSDGNCGIYSTSDYYVLVYYPNTTINTSSAPIICASTTLPNNSSSSSNPCFALHAEFLGWSNPIKFTESADGKTASCTYTVNTTSSSAKAFGIRQLSSCDNISNQAAWWYTASSTSITQTTADIQLCKEGECSGSNINITFPVVGNYVFTIEYSTMKLTVTYPATSCTAPTIAWTTAPANGTVGGNMTATVSTNQSEPTITWTSSNESVATVDANGKITYKAAGTTTITASYTGNGTTNCAEEASVSQAITVTATTITTYTVVGGSTTVFGTKDCETCTANDMVKQADGTYVLKKSVTNLSATTRDYYIVGNHDGKVWRYPASGTLQYENPTAGDYDITFTLDLSTNPVTVSCTMVKAVSSTNFYYYDSKGDWKDANCVKFTKETEYAYATLTGYQQDNEFKIFDGNTKSADNWWGNNKDNDHTVACAPHIDNSLGNIALGKAGSGNYDNAKFSAASISTSTFYVILYYPNTTLNSTSTYKLCASTTLPGGETPKETYYYFDDKKTGWDGTVGVALTDAGDYAYVLRPAYSNTDNKFKIFRCNPKQDNNDCLVANGDKIAADGLAGDIILSSEGGDNNNIQIEATCADYFVVLYYPNTTLNNGNTPLVAAMYGLPGAEEYNVTFGVVGNAGGSLSAKSGCSTLTSGQKVSHATFTATPAAGYSVEGWYSDAEGNTKITAAGTKTTYSQAITEANNTVYVKFVKTYAIYYKFNDQKWDDNYYAYIFTDEVWHSDNGVQPKVNRSEFGKMSKYNDSVYYYKFTGSADYTRFAFSWGDHSNDNYFNDIDAVYRSDFHKDMPVFIAERGQSASVTKGKYYNKGVWMKFNDTEPGYNLGLRNQTDNNSYLDESYRFTAANAGDYISTVDVVLTKGKKYSFLVKNDKAYYFTPNTDTKWTSSDSHFELYNSNNSKEVVIEPDTTGIYTFQLNLANGKVEIDVLYPTTSYRLVYVEKNSGTIKKFHPSHIIKSHPEATAKAPMFDTVSMHVRLKLLNKKAVTGTTNVAYDTVANTNTCEVWLQEFKEVGSTMEWVTIQNINTKEHLTTNGVYNFIITQANGSATIEPTAIRPYAGRYYIRTDASDGGRNNYKQLSNYCYYTEYSRVYRGFDYYYCHWTKTNTNITYTIACDYSYCVSDTLAQEDHDPHSTYTNAEGKLLKDANVRFMWHSFSNELDRAYIAGADNNLDLMSKAGIYDMKGNQNTSAKLEDQQNWVYRVDVKADNEARIKLRAVPYNGADTYSWFRGRDGDGDFSDANTEQLIKGTSGTKYTIRVIYDFKTDHLICAWIPDKDTITANDVINADLMIIRKDQGKAAQLNFKPNKTQLTNITVAYCVLNLTRDSLKSEYLTPKEKSCYWVSFPFDVNLSDVFGCGKYGEDFIIQYYDGAERAQKGCWKDSPTYWKYITNPTGVVLKKGMGYVLVIDYKKILSEQFKHSNTSVNIYFPSSGPIDAIDGVLPTAVEVPKHECTITRNERYIYDSNWNIIGVPTWANIDEFGNPMPAEQRITELSQGGSATYTIGFYYAHDAKNSKWIVCDTKKVDFWSMYSYLVQWAGTINWQEKSASGKHHPSSLAPRRYAPAAEEEGEATASEQYTLRLTLHRGETQLDHTYIRLQEGNVTTDFDLNYDMTKILNSGANLYSLVGTNLIQCAANVQPLQEEARTISIPLGVVADQDGLYTFSLPDGTEGMNVSIADSESGTVHNLALGDYQTALTKGTYEGRFALEIQPRQGVSTGCEQTDAAGNTLRKVLINGNLYILRDGKAYTAAGKEL